MTESVSIKNRDLDAISGLDESLLVAVRQVTELCPFAQNASQARVGALIDKWTGNIFENTQYCAAKERSVAPRHVNIILEDKQILLL